MARRQEDNTRNKDSMLFRQLTRLFSGPIINYRAQTQRKFRRRQLDKYAGDFKSAQGLQFKKAGYNPFEGLNSDALMHQDRALRYNDFDQMEFTPEIASAMDIYADEITTSTSLTPLLTIDCYNQEIKDILNALYHNVLNIDHNLFGWARTMCKYGDFFLYLDIDDAQGIRTAIGLPPVEVERLEGEDPTNANYIQYQWNAGGLTFENWQIAHFRVLGNDRYAPYGTAVLEPSRRIWRQLTLLEDAMMAYRIVRSPERRVFYFDVGTVAPQDVEQFMEKAKTQLKRNQVVDPTTGRVDLRYNPMSIDEDYFIPVRGSQGGTRIETLAGGSYTGDIDDVKYLRDKLFSALKIPASYLSRAEGADEDKATLAQKDIRFARTIQRLQRAIVSELEKVGIVHLYTLGFRGEDLISFKLSLNNPSKIAELQELEHWKVKFDAASGATEKFFSRRWIAKNFFGLSDDEILQNQREMFYDAWLDQQLEGVASGEEGGSDGGLGDLGGDLGGDDLGGDDLGGDLEGDLGDEPVADEDESALLSAPPKRDDGKIKTTTAKSKSYYTPKSVGGVSQRGGDQRKAGARRRHNKAQWSAETASSTARNTLKGAQEIMGLTGINEAESKTNTNYDREEKDIFKTSTDVNNLIRDLEKKRHVESDKKEEK